MVMSFQNQQALNFLLAKGYVFTFREKRRTKLGKDWINAKRGLPKVANVNIRFIRKVTNIMDLMPYVENSGFKNLVQWNIAITEVTGLHTKEVKGFLYRVSLRFGEFAGNKRGETE